MHAKLALVITEHFEFEHYVDDNMRNIPDHYHAHGRPGRRLLRSRAEAQGITVSGEGGRPPRASWPPSPPPSARTASRERGGRGPRGAGGAPARGREVRRGDPTGSGPHSVAFEIDFCSSVIADGAVLLGAFDGEPRTVCLSRRGSTRPSKVKGRRGRWLGPQFLHVSRPHRRRGAARALWDAAAELARGAGTESIYVSATPTGSAIGFYLRQGCRLADPVHPALFAHEPEDIHLVCALGAERET